MPATEKTYQHDMNRGYFPSSALDASRYQLWHLKATLKGEIGGFTGSSRWTCAGSSDSVTSASTDLWGSTYTPSKIVRGNGAAVHSWIVLQSPTGGAGPGGNTVQLLLQYNSAQDYLFNVGWSRFSSFQGGSTSSRPSASDEWGHTAAAAIGGLNIGQQNNHEINNQVFYNTALASDGCFFAYQVRSGARFFESLIALTTVVNQKSSTYQTQYNVLTVDISANTSVYAQTGGTTWYAGTGQGQITSRWSTGTTATTPLTLLQPSFWSSAGSVGTVTNCARIDSTDPLDGNTLFMPMFFMNPTMTGSSTSCNIFGRAQDIFMSPISNTVQLQPGAVDNLSGSTNYALFSNVWVPANAAPIT